MAESGVSLDINDQQMRLAVLRPCVEVECKEHGLLGYERNRADAWVVFAQHVVATHSGRVDG